MAENGFPKPLVLYTGTGCHLCEQAKEILNQVVGAEQYEVVSISGNKTLMADYGLLIPVVKNAMGHEKSWPFTAGQIKRLLSD